MNLTFNFKEFCICVLYEYVPPKNTGWPKSNVSKVGAYCSASDHQIRKISSGVYQES